MDTDLRREKKVGTISTVLLLFTLSFVFERPVTFR